MYDAKKTIIITIYTNILKYKTMKINYIGNDIHFKTVTNNL